MESINIAKLILVVIYIVMMIIHARKLNKLRNEDPQNRIINHLIIIEMWILTMLLVI